MSQTPRGRGLRAAAPLLAAAVCGACFALGYRAAPQPPDTVAAAPPAPAGTWLTDAAGNRCSVERYGSAAAARRALASLKDCVNCVNCDNCVDCTACVDCRWCFRGAGCAACYECRDCVACRGCSRCDDCRNCRGRDDAAHRREPD